MHTTASSSGNPLHDRRLAADARVAARPLGRGGRFTTTMTTTTTTATAATTTTVKELLACVATTTATTRRGRKRSSRPSRRGRARPSRESSRLHFPSRAARARLALSRRSLDRRASTSEAAERTSEAAERTVAQRGNNNGAVREGRRGSLQRALSLAGVSPAAPAWDVDAHGSDVLNPS